MDNIDATTCQVNPRRDYVYEKLDELRSAIRWDSFNLSRCQQDGLETQLGEFKCLLDEAYNGVGTNTATP